MSIAAASPIASSPRTGLRVLSAPDANNRLSSGPSSVGTATKAESEPLAPPSATPGTGRSLHGLRSRMARLTLRDTPGSQAGESARWSSDVPSPFTPLVLHTASKHLTPLSSPAARAPSEAPSSSTPAASSRPAAVPFDARQIGVRRVAGALQDHVSMSPSLRTFLDPPALAAGGSLDAANGYSSEPAAALTVTALSAAAAAAAAAAELSSPPPTSSFNSFDDAPPLRTFSPAVWPAAPPQPAGAPRTGVSPRGLIRATSIEPPPAAADGGSPWGGLGGALVGAREDAPPVPSAFAPRVGERPGAAAALRDPSAVAALYGRALAAPRAAPAAPAALQLAAQHANPFSAQSSELRGVCARYPPTVGLSAPATSSPLAAAQPATPSARPSPAGLVTPHGSGSAAAQSSAGGGLRSTPPLLRATPTVAREPTHAAPRGTAPGVARAARARAIGAPRRAPAMAACTVIACALALVAAAFGGRGAPAPALLGGRSVGAEPTHAKPTPSAPELALLLERQSALDARACARAAEPPRTWAVWYTAQGRAPAGWLVARAPGGARECALDGAAEARAADAERALAAQRCARPAPVSLLSLELRQSARACSLDEHAGMRRGGRCDAGAELADAARARALSAWVPRGHVRADQCAALGGAAAHAHRGTCVAAELGFADALADARTAAASLQNGLAAAASAAAARAQATSARSRGTLLGRGRALAWAWAVRSARACKLLALLLGSVAVGARAARAARRRLRAARRLRQQQSLQHTPVALRQPPALIAAAAAALPRPAAIEPPPSAERPPSPLHPRAGADAPSPAAASPPEPFAAPVLRPVPVRAVGPFTPAAAAASRALSPQQAAAGAAQPTAAAVLTASAVAARTRVVDLCRAGADAVATSSFSAWRAPAPRAARSLPIAELALALPEALGPQDAGPAPSDQPQPEQAGHAAAGLSDASPRARAEQPRQPRQPLAPANAASPLAAPLAAAEPPVRCAGSASPAEPPRAAKPVAAKSPHPSALGGSSTARPAPQPTTSLPTPPSTGRTVVRAAPSELGATPSSSRGGTATRAARRKSSVATAGSAAARKRELESLAAAAGGMAVIDAQLAEEAAAAADKATPRRSRRLGGRTSTGHAL